MVPRRGWWVLSGWTFGVVGTGVAVAVGATPLGCWISTPLPSDPPAAAERIEADATQAGAAELLPEEYAVYRRRLVEARSMFRREADRWCVLQDRAHVEQAFAGLERDGRALLLAARERRAAARQETADHLEATERRLVRLRSLQTELGMYLRPPPLASADLALREARQYLDAGVYERVRERVDVAAASLRTAEGQARNQVGRYSDGPSVARWRRWIQEAVALSRTGPVIVVAKAERRLFLYRKGHVVGDYPIDLGFNALADKLYEGDGATPEGRFRVVAKKSGSETRYDRALVLDYPTPDDRRRHAQALRHGLVPRRARIGGMIEIHGRVPGPTDRTNGCVSLDRQALVTVFDLVDTGTLVTIVGAASPRNPVAQQIRAWRQGAMDFL
jgi:hypothetical protein